MQRSLIALGGILTLSLMAGCGILPVRYERAFSHTAPWNDYQRLVVCTRNGRVTAEPAAVDQIRIDGTLRADLITRNDADEFLDQIEIVTRADEHDPTVFLVELKVPAALRRKSVGADFDIRIPAPCAAEIETSNGRIEARNLKDRVVLRCSNGNVRAEKIAGTVDASTSNGRIQFSDVTGDARADTSNGRVIVDRVRGDCDLTTSNGSIEAREIDGGVLARTSNGSITLQARPNPDSRIVLDTSNGGIVAHLLGAVRGRFSADTSNGGIDVNFGSITTTKFRHLKDSLRAELNGGGVGCIEARSSNGSISITCE